MTLSRAGGLPELGVVNLVRNDFVPEVCLRLRNPVERGHLIINVRAEAAPEVLAAVVQEALKVTAAKFATLEAGLSNLEHFRPGKPMPTHRFDHVAA
jgi:hypothetical protein